MPASASATAASATAIASAFAAVAAVAWVPGRHGAGGGEVLPGGLQVALRAIEVAVCLVDRGDDLFLELLSVARASPRTSSSASLTASRNSASDPYPVPGCRSARLPAW